MNCIIRGCRIYIDGSFSRQDVLIREGCVAEVGPSISVPGIPVYNFDNAVILLHDAASKTSTVEALPKIIEQIQSMENTEILPITKETVVIHH